MSRPLRGPDPGFVLDSFVPNSIYNEPVMNKQRLFFPWAVQVTLAMQGTGYMLTVDFTHREGDNRYSTLPGAKHIGLGVVAGRRSSIITSPRDAVLVLRVRNDHPEFTPEFWSHVERVMLASDVLGLGFRSLVDLLKRATDDLMPALKGSTRAASENYACIGVSSFWEGMIQLYQLAAELGGLYFDPEHFLRQHYLWWSQPAKGRDMRRRVVGEQAPGVVRNNIDCLELVMRARGIPIPGDAA